MLRFGRQFPFGNVRLEIDIQAQVAIVRDAAVSPQLPDGMKVDECRLLDFAFNADAAQEFKVTFAVEPYSDWFGGFSSGEHLDAFAFEGPNREHAAVGMRDPEWMCWKANIDLVEASHPRSSEVSDLSHVASYRMRRAELVRFQLAVARSSPNRFDGRDSSPWFAVDLAMNF